MLLIERIVEKPRACSYLPDERASLEVEVRVQVSPVEMQALLERGWRRFGPVYFRPACEPCHECVSLRVLAAEVKLGRTQRRVERAGARLRRVVGRPTVDPARLALHARWHAAREASRGWEPSVQTPERYQMELAMPHPCAREAAFYDDAAGGKLVGLGIFDVVPGALSAVYFFHDPDYARLSLGVLNVLTLLADARAAGKRHVYLGYRVTGCASLRYKATFRPHELLRGRPSPDETPAWSRDA